MKMQIDLWPTKFGVLTFSIFWLYKILFDISFQYIYILKWYQKLYMSH